MGPRPRPWRGLLDVEHGSGAAQRGAAYGPVLLVNSETFSFFFFSVYSPLKADGSVSNRQVLFFSHNALDFTTVSFVDARPSHVAELSHFRLPRQPTKTRLASKLDCFLPSLHSLHSSSPPPSSPHARLRTATMLCQDRIERTPKHGML